MDQGLRHSDPAQFIKLQCIRILLWEAELECFGAIAGLSVYGEWGIEMVNFRSALALAAFLYCSVLQAAETQVYQYDALGRLVAVTRSGSVNPSIQSSYTYDRAGNRTQVVVSGATGGGPEFSCQYTINDVTVVAGGIATFTVTRSGTTCPSNSEIYYQTQNMTAVAGTHYVAQLQRTFTVTTIAGSTVTARQFKVLIELTNAQPGEGVVDTEGIGTVTP
jgi:RHS Repeat